MPPSHRYRFTPSESASACPISRFELACDFRELSAKYPEFEAAWDELRSGRRGSHGREAGASSVKLTSTSLSSRVTHSFNASLTRSLLHRHFSLEMPSLPPGNLCPPIPNRANYVCWMKELLTQSKRDLCRFSPEYSTNNATKGAATWQYRGMDIGTGASAIYPLLLSTELFAARGESMQWKFLATDIDPLAIESARTNVQANRLEDKIFVTQVGNANSDSRNDEKSQKGPLFAAMEEANKLPAFNATPKFDFVMTNPPFYSSASEANAPRAGDKRARTDMSANEGVYVPVGCDDMDNNDSLTADSGGDVGFIAALINDSQILRRDVTWYTSLIAKRSSLDAILKKLQVLDGVWGNRGQIRTVEFRQGNMDSSEDDERWDKRGNLRVRWGVGWTYERATGRCSACRVRGGLQSFDVWVCVDGSDCREEDSSEKATRASETVVSRLIDYFENVRDFRLKCSQQDREHGDSYNESGKCVTIVEDRFFNRNPSSPPSLDHEEDNANLPYEGHFIIEAFVTSSGISNESGHRVRVDLQMHSHSKRGTAIINKVRRPLPGEIGRTNRRWRRLLKRQSVDG